MNHEKINTQGLYEQLADTYNAVIHEFQDKHGETFTTLSMPTGRFYRRTGPDEFTLQSYDYLDEVATKGSRELGRFRPDLSDEPCASETGLTLRFLGYDRIGDPLEDTDLAVSATF